MPPTHNARESMQHMHDACSAPTRDPCGLTGLLVCSGQQQLVLYRHSAHSACGTRYRMAVDGQQLAAHSNRVWSTRKAPTHNAGHATSISTRHTPAAACGSAQKANASVDMPPNYECVQAWGATTTSTTTTTVLCVALASRACTIMPTAQERCDTLCPPSAGT